MSERVEVPEYIERATTSIPLAGIEGTATMLSVWSDVAGNDVIVALEFQNPAAEESVPLVRVHSACLTGDVFGSLRCDCGEQLAEALRRMSIQRRGAIVYPLLHEGRGIGLIDKVRAYARQDTGLNTFQANLSLGYPPDARDYRGCAAVLRALGLPEIRLLSRNPAKALLLEAGGVTVHEVVPLDVAPNEFNRSYLADKAEWFSNVMALVP